MKLIDVEPIIKNLSAMKTQLGYDAIEIDGMIKALREAEEVTAAQQPNNPLTLEELREMDGEPVWVTPLYGRSPMWCFVVVPLDDADKGYARNQTRRFGTVCNGIEGHFKTYGKTWLAYRRRPEEGEK